MERINYFKDLTIYKLDQKHLSNKMLLSKSFVDLLEIEEIIRTNKYPNFALLFDNNSINEIVNKSKQIASHIIFHQRYEFSHFDLDFLLKSYSEESVKLYIYELYENHFIEDVKELIVGLREILTFFRRIETTKKKLSSELRESVIQICYCIHTIKHFMDKPTFEYLKSREVSLQEFYTRFQKLMSKSHWRIQFINLSAKKITNVSDHLQILKAKREQNFILWTIVGATIAFFVKELLFNILHALNVPFF